MAKYVAEFTGTFLMVLAITLFDTVSEGMPGTFLLIGSALVSGVAVALMINLFGERSGAHLNPAVTLGFALHQLLPWKQVPGYVIAQLTGGLVAAYTTLLINGKFLGATVPGCKIHFAFATEIFISFFLMLVILKVSSGAKEKGFAPAIAIGAYIVLAVLVAGPISGSSMNPARSFGPAIIGGHLNIFWLYLVAPLVGSSLTLFAKRILSI